MGDDEVNQPGGGRPDLPGAFFDATLLTDVTPDMRAYHEELFGPVGVIYRARDDDDAVRAPGVGRVTGLGGRGAA